MKSVITAHPGKFVGCLLADPTPGGGGARAIRELAATGLFRAARFNPYLWPEGERMTNEVRRLVLTPRRRVFGAIHSCGSTAV